MLFRGLDPLPDGAAKASTPLNWLKTIEALIEALHLSISLEVPEDVDRFLSISRCQVTQTGHCTCTRRYKEVARTSQKLLSVSNIFIIPTQQQHPISTQHFSLPNKLKSAKWFPSPPPPSQSLS
jgi:hypothetical protein